MISVVEFLFDKGIFGEGVFSVDFVGIVYLDGLIIGSEVNVKFCFDIIYMQMVVDGEF